MKKMTALIGLTLILSACSTDEAPAPSPVSHSLPPKIMLDVQSINLADRSGLQPASSPYNSNHFSPTISEAIKQWATDRLQAAGQNGQAIIVIKDASLIAQPLPIKQGMDGWFTRQQGTKYIGRAELSIEANGNEGFATTDATAMRTVTLPEDPSPMERQEAYYTLLNGLMKDLGQNLESGIQTHMAPFITSGSAMSSMNNGLPPAPMMDRPATPSMPGVGNSGYGAPPQDPTPSAAAPVAIPLSGSYAQ